MADPRRTHEREQRDAWAVDIAATIAAFYKELRRCGVPAGAAQAISEAFTTATLEDGPPEVWQQT